MKAPAMAKDLVPDDELRSHLADWLGRPGRTGRPVVVTRQGRAAAVLVSPEMLDELEEQREVVRRTLQGLREMAAGDVIEDEEVWAEVEATIARAM